MQHVEGTTTRSVLRRALLFASCSASAGLWSEDRNLSFCAGRMENDFSANGDDCGRDYVWIRTVLLSGEAVWVWMRFCSVLLFVLGAKFSSWVVWRILTWLILPVVIRLSQRLSHACLSINNFVLWNCEWLIISVIVHSIVPYYLDNRSNSRANTCMNTQLLVGRVAFIRLKPMQSSGWYCVES